MKLLASVVILIGVARPLLLPGEIAPRDAELRRAYAAYRACMKVDIFCLPVSPCPQLNCMGDYLRNAEEIKDRYLLLSAFQQRNLLSGWRPYWNYVPAN